MDNTTVELKVNRSDTIGVTAGMALMALKMLLDKLERGSSVDEMDIAMLQSFYNCFANLSVDRSKLLEKLEEVENAPRWEVTFRESK